MRQQTIIIQSRSVFCVFPLNRTRIAQTPRQMLDQYTTAPRINITLRLFLLHFRSAHRQLNARFLLLLHPHPPEQQHHGGEKRNPCFPPNTRLLCHPKHPVHRALDFVPAVLELVIHFLRQGGTVADLVADEVCQLQQSARRNKSLWRRGNW